MLTSKAVRQVHAVKHLSFIDGLRGLAILGVLMAHAANNVPPSSSWLSWFMDWAAPRGVQLFYLTSALALCISLSQRGGEAYPLRNFYLRRLFRIAPAFWCAIAGYTLLNGLGPSLWAPDGMHAGYVLLTAVFLHGFHPETITSVVPGGWSIAVEMTFYLVLPFLFARFKSFPAGLMLLATSMALYGINRLVVPVLYHYPPEQNYLVEAFAYFNFLGQFPVFVLGMLCYHIFSRDPEPRLVLAWALGGGAVLVPIFLLWPQPLVGSALLALLVLALAVRPSALLVNRFTIGCGKISFSLYLVHHAVLTGFEKMGLRSLFPALDAGSLMYFSCVTALSIGLSLVSYHCLEKPGIQLGARLISRLERRHVDATPGGKAAPDAW